MLSRGQRQRKWKSNIMMSIFIKECVLKCVPMMSFDLRVPMMIILNVSFQINGWFLQFFNATLVYGVTTKLWVKVLIEYTQDIWMQALVSYRNRIWFNKTRR